MFRHMNPSPFLRACFALSIVWWLAAVGTIAYNAACAIARCF